MLPPGTTEHDGVALNPTLNAKPWFDSVNVFRTPILIGEAADNAFATRFRQAISDPQAPEPTHLLRINYITDEPLMNLAGFEVAWPSPSRARFLIGAALNYVSRCYCLVRRSSVMEDLEQSIRDPTWGNPLLHCKFWALFAVGELCSTRSVGTQGFPGIAFFSQALKVLGLLDELPGLDSIELLLLIVRDSSDWKCILAKSSCPVLLLHGSPPAIQRLYPSRNSHALGHRGRAPPKRSRIPTL